MFSKKALGPVVAVALLLVVGVTAVIGFQTWYQSYSSQLFTQSETQGSDLTTGVERVVGETLYFKSNKDNMSISKVEVGGQDCNFQNSTQKGITQIDISSCLQSTPSGTIQEAVIYTDQGVYSEEFIANSPSAACYDSENIGTVGTSGVCQGMLIVDKAMIDFATTNNQINSGEDFYFFYNGTNYTFGDSEYNIFTGQITNMNDLFQFQSIFNANINYWDVSSVTDMSWMFSYADNFNQSLSNWDTSNVEDMSYMFRDAISFNQPLTFDTSSVVNMEGMFLGVISFNQPLTFDTSSVTSMMSMFNQASGFNSTLNFDTSNVEIMNNMFSEASSFNQSLNFNTSNVDFMNAMFRFSNFDQDLTGWCVTNISSEPTDFATSSPLDTNGLKPVWGTCP